ncbi:ribonuclease H-like domain-containing protein, partial [Tanacetum coccineum]
CHSNSLWHYRLGHPSDQVLKALKHKIDIKGNCNSSPVTSVTTPNKTQNHFCWDLIHLDAWGPYRITSKEGFKYFLTVVDDYSRAIWGGVLLNMWTECILTATYLINRLPTSVLKGKSPYDFVFDILPNDDSEARNHGSEHRSPHVDGTKTVNNTSISNSEATHDEDGTEPLDNVHTSFDSNSRATQKDHILLYQIDNNIVEPSFTSKGNSYNIQNVVNETVSQRRS